ncbi:DUF4835 domain-containing protein [Pedobacter yulinensis]|uniref:DUF4835 domain-containing protein n=1 Tax=Pedobacter yulinensis TaxID=2126353 RepID=A0A2T3HHU3_9SPHI|nr:DUF4835 family protein [Pedobacter yulinensis]PST82007.1 DUF4835 domain-containing protein [Pedobacter yulinensis]
MKPNIFILLSLLLLCLMQPLRAQELLSRVQVLAPTVPNINKNSMDQLQKAVRDFLNNNKFGSEVYQPQERIDCIVVLTINAWDGGSSYKAQAQIQSSRPVYGTSYYATLLNMSDPNFDFNYSDGQTIDFSESTFISNLSSLLSFYAYTIIGLDKDSFSSLGGSSYYLKARNVINLAQTSGGAGWRASDGLRNRFWLNENLTSKNFELLRSFIYTYHFRGLDQMASNRSKGVTSLLEGLLELGTLDKQKLGSIFPNVYFASKADEIASILSTAEQPIRMRAFNLLSEIDPANTGKYEKLKMP